MIKDLIKKGDTLFSEKTEIMSLWQEIADYFYPERAHFTTTHSWGKDMAAHLTTSYTSTVRRDLATNISAMIRPQSRQWFKISAGESVREDSDAERWLENAASIQRRAMYDAGSQFVRATREADNDYVTFGNCIISLEPNKSYDGLLYRCWHLRDVAWCEDAEGQVYEVHRKWNPSNAQLMAQFGEKCSSRVKSNYQSKPHDKVECRHIVMRAEDYDKKLKTPWVSIYIDVKNNHIIEEVGINYRFYITPRWQVVSGSQYGYSPATVAGLPDGRLIQSMSLTLLEAGQKATDPAMVATAEAIQGGINSYAGGITWVDASYDQRTGAALSTLNNDFRGLPIGFQMKQEVALQLQDAFFLNKIALPPMGDMTAWEAQQRVTEYTRQAMPIFEPFEHEYNAPLCESSFDLLQEMGAFGDWRDMPESLQGKEIKFKFESPLIQAEERQKASMLVEAKGILAQMAEINPQVLSVINPNEALRDALKGLGAPATWLYSEDEAQQISAKKQQQEQAAMTMQQMQQGAMTAKTMAEAGKVANEL